MSLLTLVATCAARQHTGARFRLLLLEIVAFGRRDGFEESLSSPLDLVNSWKPWGGSMRIQLVLLSAFSTSKLLPDLGMILVQTFPQVLGF